MPDAPLTRRALLGSGGLAVAALVAGCTSGGDEVEPDPTRTASPDELARVAAAGRERDLEGLATAVATTYPGAAAAQAAAATHAAHAAALEETVPATPSPPADTSGSPSGSASATAAPGPSVPGDRGSAVKALAEAQRQAATAHLAALPDVSGELARLLASVAASDEALASVVGAAA